MEQNHPQKENKKIVLQLGNYEGSSCNCKEENLIKLFEQSKNMGRSLKEEFIVPSNDGFRKEEDSLSSFYAFRIAALVMRYVRIVAVPSSKMCSNSKYTDKEILEYKKPFEEVVISTLTLDQETLEEFFHAIHHDIERDLKSYFQNLTDLDPNEIIHEIMGCFLFQNLFADYFDGIFQSNIISEIIKCFKLSLNNDTNIIRAITRGLFWKNCFDSHVISSLLASPEWQLKDWDQLSFLIKEYNKFKDFYFKYYIGFGGFGIDLTYGFKQIDQSAKERAKYKIDSKMSVDDLLDFINGDSEIKNKKRRSNKKFRGSLENPEIKEFGITCEQHGVKIIDSSEDNLCSICFDSPNNSIFIPCGHRLACSSCADEIFKIKKSCPICNVELIYIYKKFI